MLYFDIIQVALLISAYESMSISVLVLGSCCTVSSGIGGSVGAAGFLPILLRYSSNMSSGNT